MAIDFSAMLSDEEKRALLSARIKQFASEGYQHTLNLAVAQASGNTELVAQSAAAIDALSDAITVHETELANLPEPI